MIGRLPRPHLPEKRTRTRADEHEQQVVKVVDDHTVYAGQWVFDSLKSSPDADFHLRSFREHTIEEPR